MKVFVITLPDAHVENEASRITAMLDSGLIDRVHIRKPRMANEDMRALISEIPTELHSRLSIHSNPELISHFPGLGWHFSASRPLEVDNWLKNCGDAQKTLPTTSGTLSRSCHSPAEAAEWIPQCDYVMLSPVFDSISKPGYLSACFNPVEEFLCCQAGNVVALGGVTPERFPVLKLRGYFGAAMLGFAWKTELNQIIEELKCYNS